MKSDLEIAQEYEMKHIKTIADIYGINQEELIMYGTNKAKVKQSILNRLKDKPDGKLIMLTGVTPTPMGEGKTCNTIGLTQALGKLGKSVMATLRQPSMGPVFGIKGGAAGGGYSQVLPMEDINLGFTGDIDAVGSAHNLLGAMLDNAIFRDSKRSEDEKIFNIDLDNVYLNRVMDMNDRALRSVELARGGGTAGVTRNSGFDITAASEVMAILALARDLKDLKERFARMTLASSKDGKFITAADIKAQGAMAAIMKYAIMPNLVQTLEGQGCLIHAGPFANIAHGCNSVIADRIALKLADYVFTESGFGSDLGAQKFFDIKCRQSGLVPSAVILVVSVRAMKMHGGGFEFRPGQPMPKEEIERENVDAVKAGSENMVAHIDNLKNYGIPVLVALNRFPSDTDAEINALKEIALKAGANDAVISDAVAKGGDGAIDLAKSLIKAIDESKGEFKLLYPDDMSIKEKIETISKKTYGADGVDYSEKAARKIEQFEKLGLGKLPICMAKTHLSLTDNPALKGRPKNFRILIDDIRPSTGAGFLYPILGKMLTMPGLPLHPSSEAIDIDENGKISGLF